VSIPQWQRDILKHGELFRVGGHVRDSLLDPTADPPDTDFLVRGIPPDRLEALLGEHGHLVLVGKSFGVYRFTPTGSDEAVEIGFPRLERSTGPGHRDFEVQWDWRLSVEADLERRDFTINAMAENVQTGERIDPLDGERDLRARMLRAVFPEAFVEDPLRVLRGIRFVAQFGLEVETVTRERMHEGTPMLSTVSAERVQDEFSKLLTRCEKPSVAFELAHKTGALQVLLPELDRCAGVEQNEYHPDDVFVHSLKTCDCAPRDNLAVRWAALLHDVGKVDARTVVTDERGLRVVFYGHEKGSAVATSDVLGRLRYPKVFVDKCRRLVEHHMYNYLPEWKDATVRRFMRTLGEDNLDDMFLLREADCRSRDLLSEIDNVADLRDRVAREIDARHTLRLADLAVDGSDVIAACGVEPGPSVGAILDYLLDRVIDEPKLNDRKRLLEIARKWKDHGGEEKNRKPQ
jgi:tRNA nucleotidyltransferase/poly(A) polymerase